MQREQQSLDAIMRVGPHDVPPSYFLHVVSGTDVRSSTTPASEPCSASKISRCFAGSISYPSVALPLCPLIILPFPSFPAHLQDQERQQQERMRALHDAARTRICRPLQARCRGHLGTSILLLNRAFVFFPFFPVEMRLFLSYYALLFFPHPTSPPNTSSPAARGSHAPAPCPRAPTQERRA